MRNIIIIMLAFMTDLSFGQDYFYNIYDPFDREIEKGSSIQEHNNELYINCESLCEDNSNGTCYKVLNLDFDGNLISAHYSSNLDGISEIYFEENIYYVGGDDEPINEHFRLYKSSIDGDSIDFIQFEPEWRYFNHFNYGTYRYQDKILVFGEAVDRATVAEGGGHKSVGIAYVTDLDLNLDTVLIIDPFWEEMRIEHMSVDDEGNLIVLLQGDFPAEFAKPRRKIIKKFNSKFEEIFHWESYDFFLDISQSNFDLLSSGNIVLDLPSSEDETTNALLCLNPLGEEIWRYDFKHLRQRDLKISDVKALNDDGIAICGSVIDFQSQYGNVPFILKVDKNGKKLWERRYANYRSMQLTATTEDFYGYSDYYTGFFADLYEDDEGAIYATGLIRVPYTHPEHGEIQDEDVLVAKLDKDGCLEPDCSVMVTPGDKPEDHVVIPENRWIYEVTDAAGTNPRILEYKFDSLYTEIEGAKYRQLLYRDLSDETWIPIEEYYREFGYTVWVYKDTKTPQLGWIEDIVYDFSIVPPRGPGSISLILEGTNYKSTLKDTITLLNGERRARWHFECLGNVRDITVEWIEGIGSNRSHHAYAKACVSEEGLHELLCFSTDGEVLWEHATKQYCRTPTQNNVIEDLSTIIYPNPTSDVINIQSDIDFTRLSILDQNAKIIFTQPYTSQLPITDLQNGVYFLQLESKEGSLHKRFTVIH